MHARSRLGFRAENDACDFLLRRGFTIRARNFRTRCGEIDVIATRGRDLFIVEVKARRNACGVAPLAQVTARKQQHIIHTAYAYLAEFPWRGSVHLAVLGVDYSIAPMHIEWLPDAFGTTGA